MQNLIPLVERENIFLSYKDLSYPTRNLLGLYYFDPVKQTPNIVLDLSLEHNLPLHRSVLAEELGHYFTAPQASILTPYTSYNVKMILSRDEEKALRWACDFLVPVEKFVECIEKGVQEVEEIADYFAVTKFLILRRIHFLNCTYNANRFLSFNKMVAPSLE